MSSDWTPQKLPHKFYSDVMLPMPKVVGWTRNIKFIISWLDAYVEAADLGINSFNPQ